MKLHLAIVALIAAFVIGSTTSATAQVPTITVCVSGDKQLHLPLDGWGGQCLGNSLTWNVTGPTGPEGPAGPQGAPGKDAELPPAVAAATTTRLKQATTLETKLRAARRGSMEERRLFLAILRLQRQTDAGMVAALSP